MKEKQFFSASEIADMLDVGVPCVYELIHTGALQGVKVRRLLRVSDKSLQAYLAAAVVKKSEDDMETLLSQPDAI